MIGVLLRLRPDILLWSDGVELIEPIDNERYHPCQANPGL